MDESYCEGETGFGVCTCTNDGRVGVLEPVVCEPDTDTREADGVYVTYEYLGQLVRRAQATVHCVTCSCGI